MMLPLYDRLRFAIRTALSTQYAVDRDAAAIPLETPPNRDFGDVGSPVAFELARELRKAPRVIAQELATALGPIDGVTSVSAAPNGYLNVFLDRGAFLTARLSDQAVPQPRGGKTIVEHTAINPNKAAHIGHLRNACLGDTLVRALRLRGTPVEVQNYIDDTGVQVADVVVGLRHIERLDLAQVIALAESTRFDYHCWDLYARVTEWYQQDGTRLALRAETLHEIEHATDPSAAIGAFVAERIVRTHLVTMGRLGIDYELLTWEGDILRLQFWSKAFDLLKAKGAVFLQTKGKLAGCWVMTIDDDGGVPADTGPPPDEAADEAAEAADDEEPREKVIVRSNGTVTYVGKDMAYQFWKLGVLGRDFRYRKFATRLNGDTLWATTSRAEEAVEPHPSFGAATATVNVIDVRQAYLQQLLKQALAVAGHPDAARLHTHFSYEMVALSHATARELGCAPPAGSEEAAKPFVEVSGRKGLGVKADDLLDRMIDKALGEVVRRNPELPAADARQTAERVGVAAVRYFMVKFSRTKVIAFDIDEALSFEGESGPYLQYAVVRANNIFQKLRDRDGLGDADIAASLGSHQPTALSGDEGADRLWSLVLDAAKLDDVVDGCVRTLEFAALAKYAFSLAQGFNAVYHALPVLGEERHAVRLWRAGALGYVRRQLTAALVTMGIDVPTRM
ncbi:MAG: arginine--tRNA ligase [Acidobacteria bacterium]|nr:arginine--tRNA ligase [Acidobacteriota bacterium]